MNQPILLIAIPLLLAFISVLVKRASVYFLLVGVLFNAVYMWTIETGSYIIGDFKPPYGINLNVDHYALSAVIVINILFTLIIFVGFTLVEKHGTVLLIALASLNGLLMTGDLFNLFVFLEIASISAFIMVAMNKKYLHVFNYLVIGSLGSSLYLLGVILLYGMYGTLNMADLHSLMAEKGVVSQIPLLLIFAGLAVETKLLPFNSWVKGVLESSNRLVGPLIASVYAGVMLIIFGRLFGDVFILEERLQFLLSIVALVTFISGEFAAFQGKKVREILLYSSVAQSGLAVLLMINHQMTVALLVIFGNVLVKFVLFTLAGYIASETGTDELSGLKGLFKKYPLTGVIFTVAAMSLVGLPMFFGFFVKINVLLNLFQAGDYLVPALILGASLIEGAYIIRMLVGLWNPGEEGQKPLEETVTEHHMKPRIIVMMATLAVSLILVVMGFYPDFTIHQADQAAQDLSGSTPSQTFTIEGGLEK